MKTLGLVGARGHTGRELLELVARHEGLSLEVASSSSSAGELVSAVAPGVRGALRFTAPSPSALVGLDAVVLALPNHESAPYVEALLRESPRTAVVDLSADHRFDDEWAYGLVERNRAALRGARLVSNPGCYATGIQLTLAPLLEVLEGDANVFGVSGYSGAGTTPSRKNDPEVLRDNLLPYQLVEHVHEREATGHLGHPVRFMPHVASFFRGIALTFSLTMKRELNPAEVGTLLRNAYEGEPLVEVTDGIPEVKDNVGRHTVRMGGVATSGRRLVVVATLDNLLKGAATQALQNVNLALGLDELAGIEHAR